MNQTHALHQLVPLAELDDNKVTPGLLGFVVFAVIALALWGLMKNMNKQMKKIDFEEEPQVPKPAAAQQPPAQRSAPAVEAAPKAPGA